MFFITIFLHYFTSLVFLYHSIRSTISFRTTYSGLAKLILQLSIQILIITTCIVKRLSVDLYNLASVRIVTRNNIVWKLERGYCLCYCKTFSLVSGSTSVQNLFLLKSAVHYLYYLKSSNTIGQWKTTTTEKYFYPWLTSFNLKLSCTQLILAKSKDLL